MEPEIPTAIVNKVSASGLLTVDPGDYYPNEDILVLDLKDFLFRELILREKDFREALKRHDWEAYRNRMVTVTCSTDAIIPVWAYMLIATWLAPVAKRIFTGPAEQAFQQLFLENINLIPVESFAGKRVVIKGCGDKNVPAAIYLAITEKLRPLAHSIMYGEPCSTVPVYKKRS